MSGVGMDGDEWGLAGLAVGLRGAGGWGVGCGVGCGWGHRNEYVWVGSGWNG
jgi:hypothetical protein